MYGREACNLWNDKCQQAPFQCIEFLYRIQCYRVVTLVEHYTQSQIARPFDGVVVKHIHQIMNTVLTMLATHLLTVHSLFRSRTEGALSTLTLPFRSMHPPSRLEIIA
jgi:hypothetical protein